MSRTVDEITSELKALAVDWLADARYGGLVLGSLGHVLSLIESDWEGWALELFRQTADDAWLVRWGEEFGVDRLPWEDVGTYRELVALTPRSPTPAYIEAELNRRIPIEGYSVDVIEPNRRFLYEGGANEPDRPTRGVYTGTATALLADGSPRRMFWVLLPVVELIRLPFGCFTDRRSDAAIGAYAGANAYLDGTRLGERRRYLRETFRFLQKTHPSSAIYGIQIRDNFEPVHLGLITTPGGIL